MVAEVIGAKINGTASVHRISLWYALHGKSADGIMKDGMEKVIRMD